MGNPAAVPAKCTPITVSFELMTADQLRKIIFGLTKGCNADDTSFWNIHFQLQQRDAKTDPFFSRVKLDISVDQQNNAAAEKTAKGLNSAQTDHLLGPATIAADLHQSGQIDAGQAGSVVQGTVQLANT
jgi:hypothetical protein